MNEVIRDIKRILNPQSLEDCFLPFSKFGRAFGYNNSTFVNDKVTYAKSDIIRIILMNILMCVFYYVGFTSDYSNYSKDKVLQAEAACILLIGTICTHFVIIMSAVKRQTALDTRLVLQRVYNEVRHRLFVIMTSPFSVLAGT